MAKEPMDREKQPNQANLTVERRLTLLQLRLARATAEAGKLAVEVIEGPVFDKKPESLASLSPRQMQHMELAASGLSEQAASSQLNSAYQTTKRHRAEIRRKLGVRKMSQTTAIYSQAMNHNNSNRLKAYPLAADLLKISTKAYDTAITGHKKVASH